MFVDRAFPLCALVWPAAFLGACARESTSPDAAAAGDAPASDVASEVTVCQVSWPMPNPAPSGLPHPASYDVSMLDVVRDNVTGLLWQQATFPGGYNWDDANAACAGLTAGGLTGWRLPHIVELVSLVDFTRSDPAIDTAAFPQTLGREFWAVETDLSIPGLGWYVYFLNGGAYGGNDVSDVQQVRCVHDAVPPSSSARPCYEANDQTVADTRTTLTWQRTVDPRSYTWPDAQSYCESLALAGGGWRLPSVKELMTLADLTRVDPATDPAAFPDTPSDFFWSSSAVSGSDTSAWGVSFNKGSSGTAPATFTSRVRCVR